MVRSGQREGGLTSKPHLLGVLAGFFLATGLVTSSMLVTRAWQRIAESETISVTGAARKNVRSDLAVWQGNFAVESTTLMEAQQKLKNDLRKVEAFVRASGLTNFTVSPVTISEVRAREKGSADFEVIKTVGYRLSHMVEVRSENVDQVVQLDRNSPQLIEQDILFTTGGLQFIYTKAGEAKVEMLADATQDARLRADQIAQQGGRRIAGMRSARMGVFQVNPLYSIQTSSEGNNDTSSLEKTITAVVAANFAIK